MKFLPRSKDHAGHNHASKLIPCQQAHGPQVDLRGVVSHPQSDSAAPGPLRENDKPWLIRNLENHNGRVSLADLGVEIPGVQFDLNTKLNDVPLSSDIAFASKEMQKVEFADLTPHSPLDPFVPVLNLKTVFSASTVCCTYLYRETEMQRSARERNISIDDLRGELEKLTRANAFNGEWIEVPQTDGSYAWIKKGN